MPEGHTIRRLRNDLEEHFGSGAVSVRSPQGRFTEGAALIDERPVDRFESYGKHLFGHWGDEILHVHLGLIGKFGPSVDGADDTCRLRMSNDDASWDLRGPSTCAIIDPTRHDAVLAPLGPDPLSRSKKPDQFVERLHASKKPVAALLLDQGVIAGIGNVYRSELCHLTRLDPHTPGSAVPEDTAIEIWDRIRTLMRLGVKTGRIITRDPEDVGGRRSLRRLDDDERLYVYRRDGRECHRCATPIRLAQIAQRSCWYCPECQPR